MLLDVSSFKKISLWLFDIQFVLFFLFNRCLNIYIWVYMYVCTCIMCACVYYDMNRVIKIKSLWTWVCAHLYFPSKFWRFLFFPLPPFSLIQRAYQSLLFAILIINKACLLFYSVELDGTFSLSVLSSRVAMTYMWPLSASNVARVTKGLNFEFCLILIKLK